MKRGTIVILLILAVALISAFASVWYHYRNQHLAQQFWGTETALLIDKADQVEVIRLAEPDRRIESEPDDPEVRKEEKEPDPDAPPAPQAVEFDQTPWLVIDKKDAAAARGIANLRRALVLDTTFDWASPPATEPPQWQYGVAVNDGKNWAAVLFDFKTRQVGLTGGHKTVLLEAEANREFEQFFSEQLPEKKAEEKSAEDQPSEEKPAEEKAAEKPSEEKPAEPAAETPAEEKLTEPASPQ